MMDENVRDVMYFFIILDDPNPERSILNYKITETIEVGEEMQIEVKDFLSEFPFEHYAVLRDVKDLSRTIL